MDNHANYIHEVTPNVIDGATLLGEEQQGNYRVAYFKSDEGFFVRLEQVGFKIQSAAKTTLEEAKLWAQVYMAPVKEEAITNAAETTDR